MDYPYHILTIEKGLSRLNDIQKVKVNYSTVNLRILSNNARSPDSTAHEMQESRSMVKLM